MGGVLAEHGVNRISLGIQSFHAAKLKQLERGHTAEVAIEAIQLAMIEHCEARGDRVAILSPNSHFFLESFYGTSAIGAVLVPLNFRLQATDLEYILDHAGVVCAVVDHEYTDVADEMRGALGAIRETLAEMGVESGKPAAAAA